MRTRTRLGYLGRVRPLASLRWPLLLFAFLTIAARQETFAQNLLVNGNFEQNDRHTYANYYASEDLAYIPLGDSVPGWTFSHSVDLYGPGHDPQNGSQFLDLVGGGPLSATFSIQQTFATTAGQSYQLSFFYGNNEQLANAMASFTASLIGGAVTIWTQDFTHTGDTYYAHDWTSFSLTFVANSSSTTLKFLDTSHFPTNYDPSYTVAGSTLDNVSVVAVVPESGGIGAGLTALAVCLIPVAVRRRALPGNH
jgi:uncharacterized protein DUF642